MHIQQGMRPSPAQLIAPKSQEEYTLVAYQLEPETRIHV